MPGSAAKLKASCDRCAADKVKCGKQHPSCQRCTQAKRECIYGVSQRAGKPSKAKLALRRDAAAACSVPLISAAPSTTAGSPNVLPAPSPEPSNGMSDCWLVSRDPMLESLPWPTDVNIPDMVEGNHSTAYRDPCAALATPSLTAFSLASSQAMTPCYTAMDVSGDFSMSDIMSPKSCSRSSAPLDGTERSCCEPRDVAKRLCDIFELEQANSMTLDVLLQEIITLSQKLNNHLRCSCAKDCSVLMMLAASECEILDLYQAVANVKLRTPQSGGRPTRKLSISHSELSLGRFKFDEKMGSAVRDQLVLTQLHEMIETWEQYIDSLSYDQTKAIDDRKLPFIVTSILLSRLKSTVNEIESRRKSLPRGNY